jgi:hypothetical protein
MVKEKLEKQAESKQDKTARIQPYQWKKGQSGNPAGRQKGKTMKEYAKELLACQTEEERQEFLEGLDKDVIWKMAEGNPQTDITSGGEKINPIPIINVLPNNSDQQNNTDVKEAENSTGGNISEQDNINSNILDSVKPVGQDTNTDEHSVGELSTPKEGSGEGLSEHNEGTPILQGQQVGQDQSHI